MLKCITGVGSNYVNIRLSESGNRKRRGFNGEITTVCYSHRPDRPCGPDGGRLPYCLLSPIL